jgi:acid phosphatase family membrane protein YuiD
MALIVMNDAMKVRWVTQEQSKVINKLTEGKPGFKKMSEHVGHKPLEVLVGLIIGIIIPIIIYAIIK